MSTTYLKIVRNIFMSIPHIRILFLYTLLSFLTACDNNPEDTVAGNSQIPALKDAEMILSPAGVGPLNAKTTFNIHKITQAFAASPNRYHVEQIQKNTEARNYTVIRISKNTDTLLLINPDAKQENIFSILIKDRRIGNILGHTLGMEYGAIYSYGHTEQCSIGKVELASKVLCYAPQSNNIIYLFSARMSNKHILNNLPPADALDSWKLESIIWKPKP